MYYIAKLFQASGLVIILLGFIARFPHLMSPKILVVGLLIFGVGFLIDKGMLKK